MSSIRLSLLFFHHMSVSHFFPQFKLLFLNSKLKQIFSIVLLFEDVLPPLTAATKWIGRLTSSGGLCAVKQ